MTAGIRTRDNWLLVYSSGRKVGAHWQEGQSEVYIPESPCCLDLAPCPQRKCLTSQPLECLQPLPGSPASPHPLMPAAVIRRTVISTQRQMTSCKQTKQSPMKQGCMAKFQRRQNLSLLFFYPRSWECLHRYAWWASQIIWYFFPRTSSKA